MTVQKKHWFATDLDKAALVVDREGPEIKGWVRTRPQSQTRKSESPKAFRTMLLLFVYSLAAYLTEIDKNRSKLITSSTFVGQRVRAPSTLVARTFICVMLPSSSVGV